LRQQIKDLIEQYLEIVHSARNQKNRPYWERVDTWNRDMWRGIPRHGKSVPFTVAPDNSLWSHILQVDLRDYYNDPEIYLETQLKLKIYHFHHFNDNTYFTDELYIWFGVITELSFFGAPIIFYPNKEGWIAGNVIKIYTDLERLTIPDFYKSGLMPKIHRYYEVMHEYAAGKLRVMFPEWVRGPFCIATHLRGMENILIDTVENPDFIYSVMQFLVESNKHWNAERNKFLTTEIKTCKLYNDEIGTPAISPRVYKTLIFPYEKELSDYYGEVAYWHSCGDTTKFQSQINKLTNLKMYHCGPWTSYAQAVKHIDKTTALDICLNPQSDVLEADEHQMFEKLEDIRRICDGLAYFVRADGFMLERDVECMLKKIQQWNTVASRVLNR
jgi:uroporphyrinogen-III decarboxylase